MLGAIEEAVNVGDKVAQTINPAIPTVNLSNKGNTVTLKVAGKLAEAQAESQSEFGMLGAIEEAVNVGDKVAQTINPAIPTVNLSNKGNTVTLKVAGKLAEAQAESQSEFGMLGAIEEAVNVGDKVAQTINPAIPTVNLSNKGNTVTLKVAGKI
jgi:ribosomal protein L21E